MTDIIKTSASAIESFDDSTPFGCERRWYFEKVMKLPVPPRENLTLGTNLHTAVENFLIKGSPGEMSPEVQRLFHAIKPEVIRVRDEGFLALEHNIDFLLAPDVRIIGRIDVLRKNGPLDWKTSSDVGKYAPTPYKLARSTQMVTYAAWQDLAVSVLGSPWSTLGSPEQVTHVYVQTKGHPVTQRVDALMTPSVLTEGVSRVINIAREMKAAAKLPNANDLRPDRSKCRANTKNPCPFLAVCPVENSTMSSALDRLKARLNTSTPLPPAVKEVVKAASAPPAQAIVPPDAPAPAPVEKFMAVPPPLKERKLLIHEEKPSLEAEVVARTEALMDTPHKTPAETTPVVEGKPQRPFGSAAVDTTPVVPSTPATAEAPKRGPGRPPGSKNKQKTAAETLPEGSTGTGGLAQAVAELKPTITFKTVTVSMTGKLNMGHFQSLDVYVSQTAEYTGSPDEAFSEVTSVVKRQLDAALENIAGRTVQAPVPPEVLMSTKR